MSMRHPLASTLAMAVAGLVGLAWVAAAAATDAVPALGPGADLHGRVPFPKDSAWNTPVDKLPVDPNSDRLINSIGRAKRLHPDFGANWNGGPFGIPYVVVPGTQAKVKITYTAYGNESDPGPFPVPGDAPVEGGVKSDGDRHLLVLDRDHWVLYELYRAFRDGPGWKADSGAVWDLKSNKLRPAGWTSADAAGLPIFPGLVRYDEVVGQKEIRHALRFTCQKTRRAYVLPATHWASRSRDANLPPMGMRVRLKASVAIAAYPPDAQVILTALRTYGMILADNGGDWFVSGAPDARWNDENVNTLKRITGADFEVVKMENVKAE